MTKCTLYTAAALGMLVCTPFQLRAASAHLPVPTASSKASRADEAALWDKIEQFASAAVEGAGRLRRTAGIEGGKESEGSGPDIVISPGLTATNVTMDLDQTGQHERLSFELRGGCISTRGLLAHYPEVLVLGVPKHPDVASLLGTILGDAVAVYTITSATGPEPGPCITRVSVLTVENAKARMLLRLE